jgi:hypothetical protein
MHVLVCEDSTCLLLSNKILVEDTHSQEVCSGAALEAGSHFNHPVNHFGSVLGGYLVTFNGIGDSPLRVEVEILSVFLELFHEESRLDILKLGTVGSSTVLKGSSSLAEGIDFLLPLNLLFEIYWLFFLEADVRVLVDAGSRLVEHEAA